MAKQVTQTLAGCSERSHTHTNTHTHKRQKAKSTAAALAVTLPGYKSQGFLCVTQDLWAHADKYSSDRASVHQEVLNCTVTDGVSTRSLTWTTTSRGWCSCNTRVLCLPNRSQVPISTAGWTEARGSQVTCPGSNADGDDRGQFPNGHPSRY